VSIFWMPVWVCRVVCSQARVKFFRGVVAREWLVWVFRVMVWVVGSWWIFSSAVAVSFIYVSRVSRSPITAFGDDVSRLGG